MRWSRIELAVATAAALVAYALAYLEPPSRMQWPAATVAVVLAAAAFAVRWTPAPSRVMRGLAVVLKALLVAIGSLVVFSRQFPLVRYAHARTTGAAVGGALGLLALVFLAGRRTFPVHTRLLPAILGVLVAAGLERSAPGFAPLAGLAGLAAWSDAFRSGGPRRRSVSLAITAGAGVALAAGIAWALPVAQPYVQEMIARAYRGGRTGLSDRSELGEVASLALSHRVVARVWTDRPQLLRMQVFAQFDGRRWVAYPRDDARRMNLLDRAARGPLLASVPGQVYSGGTVPPGPGLTETRVLPDLWMEDGWGLLTPRAPLFLVWPDEGVAIDERGLVTTGGSLARLYGVMNRADSGGPARPAGLDLALPMRVDPRIRQLAATLRRDEPPGPALVGRTVDHLRTYYRYTLDVGPFRTRDPLAEFLFDKRAGYCEYFATATVILLRLQGVPARYVKGVSVRPESSVGPHYVVRESDAHAWADVWTA
ncbi:MAG TPA: transglutaminaseTgpA domain-containing protein, partial [Vicinamibacteria bacterium]|nr:transglutaminaseTgpA domain-containing protein [Vicinamibacteria bacterium]